MREKVRMQSTESAYFYTTDKNKKAKPTKMKFKKYDPVVRKHVLFEEEKIKS